VAESSYWQRFWRRRLSRRRLLTGAALGGAGLAAALTVGCDGDSRPGPTATATPAAGPWGGDVYPYDGRRALQPAPGGVRGGVLRYPGFDALRFDTFDPHQTQFGPLASGHSAVFSKMLRYVSHETQEIAGDLVESWEVVEPPPETRTYIFHLRRDVTFHDTPQIRERFPGLAGRRLTAADVKFSLERQMNPDSPRRRLYYRASQYETIERIDTPDDFTVRIITKEPIATLLHYLADTYAFIVPREVVDADTDKMDEESRMIGSGPFIWKKLQGSQRISFVRNPNWFGWGEPELGRPYLDGYEALFLVDDSSRESAFRNKEIDDAGFPGGFLANPSWVFNVKRDLPEVTLWRLPLSGWLNSRLKTNCPPYDNVLLRKAIHLAADRQQIIDSIWQGEGRMHGPVSFAITTWALPDEELKTIPGYRSGSGRQEDIALARSLYEAAGRPSLRIAFADTPTYIPEYANTFIENLKQVFGGGDIAIDGGASRSYTQIVEGFLRGCDHVPFSWGFENGWIDLDDWVYPFFHSRGSKNSFGVADPELDGLLEAQRREFDQERRRDLGFRIQRYLLGVDPAGSGRPLDPPPSSAFARLDYASVLSAIVSWPYVKSRVAWPWFGNNHWLANTWLDRDDSSFQGRPD
jgi:peptide/nickel transport system substrate-binding protein